MGALAMQPTAAASLDVVLLNCRPTILHLPAAIVKTKDSDGGETTAIQKSIQITPGSVRQPVATVITRETWERAQKHPTIKQWLALGWIREKPADVEAPTDVPPPKDLSEYAGPAAIGMVETEASEGALRSWLAAESRAPVRDAITKRLGALAKPAAPRR